MSRVSLFCVLSLFSINLLTIALGENCFAEPHERIKKKPATQDSAKPSTTIDQQKIQIIKPSTSLISNELPGHQVKQTPGFKRIVCPFSNDSTSLIQNGPGLTFSPVGLDKNFSYALAADGTNEWLNGPDFRLLQVSASMPSDSELVCNYSKLVGSDIYGTTGGDHVLQTLGAGTASTLDNGCRHYAADCSFISPNTMTCANSNGCNYSVHCPSSLTYGLNKSVSLPSGWSVGPINNAPFVWAKVFLVSNNGLAMLNCEYSASSVNQISFSYTVDSSYNCAVSPTGASFDCTLYQSNSHQGGGGGAPSVTGGKGPYRRM